MKKSLKIAAGILLAAAVFFAVTACGSKNEETTAETTAEVTTMEKETVSVKNENLLTGLDNISNDAVGKRPVAIMINNVADALPQYGVEQADMIIEMPVESGLTRLMAFYSDYTRIPDIISIRSCRYYFPAVAQGFDAVYLHWGIDGTVIDYVNGLGIDRIDLDDENQDFVFDIRTRSEERLNAGYNWEHSTLLYGSKLPGVFEQLGFDMNLKPDYQETFFKFDEYTDPIIPTGDACSKVDISFGSQSTQLEYDESSNTYKKFFNNEPHADGTTKRQYAYTNVFILETSVTDREDGYHKAVDWKGGSDSVGYYLSNGKMQKIHWSKEDEKSKLVFTDEDGNELTINRGKVYIGFCQAGSESFQ